MSWLRRWFGLDDPGASGSGSTPEVEDVPTPENYAPSSGSVVDYGYTEPSTPMFRSGMSLPIEFTSSVGVLFAVASGAIGRGPVEVARYPAVWSGSATARYCAGCSTYLGNYVVGDQVVVAGISGLHVEYCWKCANYRYQQGGFWTRDQQVAEWILEGIPFTSGVQLGVLTDWLKDNNRYHEADFLQKHWSGH